MQLRPALIETQRLALVVLVAEEIRALLSVRTQLAEQLAGVAFPTGWPLDPEARGGLAWHLRHLEESASQRAWRIRVIVERTNRLVIGSISLKGPPDANGDVEMGWGVERDFRQRGYASEAAAAVATWVLEQPGVRVLTATIPDENDASQRVAERLGMVQTHEKRREVPLWRRVPLAPASIDNELIGE
jgi:ribosomal-protein-alanine N-acetyltransferase